MGIEVFDVHTGEAWAAFGITTHGFRGAFVLQIRFIVTFQNNAGGFQNVVVRIDGTLKARRQGQGVASSAIHFNDFAVAVQHEAGKENAFS